MRDSLKTTITIQLLIISALVTISLDIPIARQIIGFVCVSFIPGILILKILRLDLKSRVNSILLSMGLSVSFLMFVGLLTNELYPLFGISKPLSTLPLLVTVGASLSAMSFINYRRHGLQLARSLPTPNQVLRAVPLIAVPLLAIFGAVLTNSFILLLMVAAIAVLVMLTILSKELIPPKLIPFVVLVIAISLLFQNELISKYLVGADVFGEYYLFRLTKSISLWSSTIPISVKSVGYDSMLSYNAMLSTTILPTIYSNLLNMQGESIFKIIYRLLFSSVPVSFYQIYHERFGKLTAFLSVFYFVLFPRFYIGSARKQMIGELFFVLLIFLILNKKINLKKRQILLFVFGASLVVSHYSLAYIYLFIISFAWFFSFLAKKFTSSDGNQSRTNMSGGYVALFFTMTFSWYTFVSISTSESLWELVRKILTFLVVDFFSLEARGTTIFRTLTPNLAQLSFAYQIDTIVNKLTYFFLVIGIIIFFMKTYKEMKFEKEYALMVGANVLIFAMVLVIPHVAPAFLPDRFYHVLLFFLAPLCVLGGKTFFKWVLKPFKKIKLSRLLCIFFVIIFLFKVGFIYEVIGDTPGSISISFNRMKTDRDPEIKARFYLGYVPEEDVYSAIWLSNMAGRNFKIYADRDSVNVLRSYGMINVEHRYLLYSNAIIETDAYIYLRYLNVHGLLREPGTEPPSFSNITEVSYQLNWTNKIYSNGDSEVYRSFSGD